MRRLFIRAISYLIICNLLLATPMFSKNYYSSYKYKTPSYKTYTYKVPRVKSSTYSYKSSYYKSGYPKVERSQSVKRKFLKSHGYSKTPAGYEIDHIIPLSKGGKDTPSNMQLLPKQQHKIKTANERKY